MGTRADFYIGTDENAEWLGSTGWYGHPDGLGLTLPTRRVVVGNYSTNETADFPEGKGILDATTEEEFRTRVAQYFENREDVSRPEDGWPWPWDTSATTDYAYAFDPVAECAVLSCFGRGYLPYPVYVANEEAQCAAEAEAEAKGETLPYEPSPKDQVFPNMKERQNARTCSLVAVSNSNQPVGQGFEGGCITMATLIASGISALIVLGALVLSHYAGKPWPGTPEDPDSWGP
jgi:hypothetical protein